MGEWISVNELMPDIDRVCLVTVVRGCRRFISIGKIIRFDADEDGVVLAWTLEESDSHKEDIISHWMPLPDFPKELRTEGDSDV